MKFHCLSSLVRPSRRCANQCATPLAAILSRHTPPTTVPAIWSGKSCPFIAVDPAIACNDRTCSITRWVLLMTIMFPNPFRHLFPSPPPIGLCLFHRIRDYASDYAFFRSRPVLNYLCFRLHICNRKASTSPCTRTRRIRVHFSPVRKRVAVGIVLSELEELGVAYVVGLLG